MLAAFRTALARERGWELRLRSELTEAWLEVLALAQDRLGQGPNSLAHPRDERLKAMIDYIGRHYDERIGVRDIAGSAFASERECHRTFGECLGVTPTHYLRDYRIQQACRMLAHTTRPIAAVASMVGMGSPSRFGQEFRSAMVCTPSEYRARWQDSDSSGRGRL